MKSGQFKTCPGRSWLEARQVITEVIAVHDVPELRQSPDHSLSGSRQKTMFTSGPPVAFTCP